MIAMQIARIVADYVLFLEFADEETLDPDTANTALEALGRDLQALDAGFLRELIDAFAVIAAQSSDDAQEAVGNIVRDFRLEEAVAENRTADVLQIARIVANISVFFDLTDEDLLDPDTSVKMMEALGADLEALDPAFLRKLIDAFAVIAPDYVGDAQAAVRGLAHGFYLEEALAADDPVRLAELEAKRDAED